MGMGSHIEGVQKMNFLSIIKAMLPVLQFGVTSGTGIGMIYAFCKFTHKPTDTLKQRIADLEVRVNGMEKEQHEFKADVERKLQEHNDHFDELDKANKIIMQALLAIMDNALGNDGGKAKLSKSRDDLFNYLNEK